MVSRALPALVLFGVIASSVARADGVDWRFCVATDFAHRTAYLTNLFESEGSAKAVGGILGDVLTKSGASFQNVQCPLPSDRLTSEGKLATARRFIKSLGYRIVAIK